MRQIIVNLEKVVKYCFWGKATVEDRLSSSNMTWEPLGMSRPSKANDISRRRHRASFLLHLQGWVSIAVCQVRPWKNSLVSCTSRLKKRTVHTTAWHLQWVKLRLSRVYFTCKKNIWSAGYYRLLASEAWGRRKQLSNHMHLDLVYTIFL